jgi:hypothetical protein
LVGADNLAIPEPLELVRKDFGLMAMLELVVVFLNQSSSTLSLTSSRLSSVILATCSMLKT